MPACGSDRRRKKPRHGRKEGEVKKERKRRKERKKREEGREIKILHLTLWRIYELGLHTSFQISITNAMAFTANIEANVWNIRKEWEEEDE